MLELLPVEESYWLFVFDLGIVELEGGGGGIKGGAIVGSVEVLVEG